MSMASEFKDFISKGNVMDLAVGVIIGGAFGKIVDSLVNDVIMPIVGKIFGGLDFSNMYIPLNGQEMGMAIVEAKKAGAVLAYGNFISIVLNFLILAFVIFQMVKISYYDKFLTCAANICVVSNVTNDTKSCDAVI
jgi:large conductance mechanosensitive channel